MRLVACVLIAHTAARPQVPDDRSALHVACARHNASGIEALVAAGAASDAADASRSFHALLDGFQIRRASTIATLAPWFLPERPDSQLGGGSHLRRSDVVERLEAKLELERQKRTQVEKALDRARHLLAVRPARRDLHVVVRLRSVRPAHS